MKVLCILLSVALASGFYMDNNETHEENIVGGDYVRIAHVPYQAQLLQLGSAVCGATIISEYWLISAAHCFEETYGISILTGSTHRSREGQRHEINKVIVHRDYDEYTNDNDISLMKLVKLMKFNERQKPVPVATKPPKLGGALKISVYGKGGIVNAPIVDQRTCARRYIRDPITNNMFCAGKAATDACQGDSGGPGIITVQLASGVSSSMECGSTFYPGIYTRAHKYYKWTAKHTGLDIA